MVDDRRAYTAGRLLAVLLAVLASAPVQAVTCIVEGSQFTFLESGYGTVFGHGTQANADIAYGALQRELDDPADYRKPTMFFSRATTQIFRQECSGSKCTGREIQAAWKSCSDGARTTEEICLPLAVVHDGKLYCLLQPPPPFDPQKQFVPYTPPFNRR